MIFRIVIDLAKTQIKGVGAGKSCFDKKHQVKEEEYFFGYFHTQILKIIQHSKGIK